ncbi:MAG: T9SS type A sorting domain-containing protein, partial [Bacteroidota bacterium]
IDGAELIDIEYGLAEAENFGLSFVDEGLVTMSWNCGDALQCVRTTSSSVLFSLVIRATDNRQLSEVLSINDRYTMAEAYRQGQTTELDIVFADRDALQRVFTLYQNSPNPFQEMTLISFNLPQESEATVIIRDAAGQLIRVIKGDYAAGYNTIQLTKSMLQGASGVLNYTVETPEHKATRQMIVVQ